MNLTDIAYCTGRKIRGPALSALLLCLAGLQACSQNNAETDSSSIWPCKYYRYQNCSETNNSGSSQNGNGTSISAMQWAKSASGTYDSSFNSAAIDVSNNIFAAGWVDLDQPFTFGTGITVSGNGPSHNAVLVKYDLNSVPQWARTPSSADNTGSEFHGVVSDSSGNVYAVGYQESGVFTYSSGVTAVGPGSSNYPVIVKYGATGNALWVRTISTGADGSFYAVAVDGAGYVYAVGNQAANSSYTYGPGVVSNPPATGNRHAVLVKYDSNGIAQWVRTVTSASNQSSFASLVIDQAGNIYAAGYQQGSSVVSYSAGVNATGPATGSNSVLVKYDSTGVAQWARSVASGASSSAFQSIAKDSVGNIFVTGHQTGSSSYAYGNGVTALGPNAGVANAVLLKYAPDGLAQWAKTAITASSEHAFRAIAVLDSGEIFVSGYQSGSTAYAYGVGITAQSTSAYDNATIVKFDANGSALWAKTIVSGDFGSDFGSIVAANNGLLVGCGYQTGDEVIAYMPGVEATGSVAGGASKTAVIVRYQ
jgi:hypothetical protein